MALLPVADDGLEPGWWRRGWGNNDSIVGTMNGERWRLIGLLMWHIHGAWASQTVCHIGEIPTQRPSLFDVVSHDRNPCIIDSGDRSGFGGESGDHDNFISPAEKQKDLPC